MFNFKRWVELRPLLEQALELAQPERNAFVADLARHDADLAQQLSLLLRKKGEASSPIPQLQSLLHGLFDDDAEESLAGSSLGPYKLVRELGRGGMGIVYLGQRVDGRFLQHVAVKVLRTEHLPPSAIERFHRERAILARLDHAGIARLFDGGETGAGHPYYVMEYVDGSPIDVYCRRSVGTVAARLSLLREAAMALAHAHGSLVVHRDIKPANLLVTADGRIKLVDFGIAKVLQQTAPDAQITRAGPGPLTPEYAAPEQFMAQAPTVRTDIYQFGVLMFQVLSGDLPYRPAVNDYEHWRRAALDTPPQRPGRTLLARIAAGADCGYGSTASAVAHELGGDVEAVLLRAIEKDPHDRYATMDRVAHDLAALLENRPVDARRHTRRYLFGKFLRRHAVGASLVLCGIALLVGLTITAMRQAQIASVEAQRANTAATFINDMFMSVEPAARGGQPASHAEALEVTLDAARVRLDRGEFRDPVLQGRLYAGLAVAYGGIGNARQQYAAAEHAMQALRQVPLPPVEWVARAHEQKIAALLAMRHTAQAATAGRKAVRALAEGPAAASALALAHAAQAAAFLEINQWSDGLAMQRRASELASAYRTQTAAVMFAQLAQIELEVGDFYAAWEHIGEASRHPSQARAEIDTVVRRVRASVLIAFGKFEEALVDAQAAYAAEVERNGRGSAQASPFAVTLADAFIASGQSYAVVPYLRAALMPFPSDTDHPIDRANTLTKLGAAYVVLGEPQSATTLCVEAAQLHLSRPVPHLDLARALDCLAKNYGTVPGSLRARLLDAWQLHLMTRSLGNTNPRVLKARILQQARLGRPIPPQQAMRPTQLLQAALRAFPPDGPEARELRELAQPHRRMP